MILRHHDIYDEIMDYNFENRSYKVLSRIECPELIAKIKGCYSFFGDKLAILYAYNDSLCFLYDNNNYPLSNAKVSVDKKGFDRVLNIDNVHIHYSVDKSNYFEFDPTPFVEDEDFDFGLFIANILRDKGRCQRCIARWSGSILED